MYTGAVKVGGAAQTRELSHLIISKLAVGPFDNNTYLLRCRSTQAQILIDAAAEPDRILTLIGPRALEKVLITHGHRDHWQALAEVVSHSGALTAAPEADRSLIDFPIEESLKNYDRIRFGDCELEVITVGGHTPGCSLFLYRDPTGHEHLFSGDALFPGGVGKTNTPEAFATLFSQIKDLVFGQLSDLTWVYPGHGDDTTLGSERPKLDEWENRGW
jgi:glyoxylase-like metal-dependent hydrolase (beta-lactamase superfamily II)